MPGSSVEATEGMASALLGDDLAEERLGSDDLGAGLASDEQGAMEHASCGERRDVRDAERLTAEGAAADAARWGLDPGDFD